MSWLNYHHLFYFRTIATEGTVAKAAAKLRLGQPTLSTQLMQFESAIGHKLFERRQRRLYISDAGRVALEYANEIFRLGDEMLEALGDRLSAERVAVAIGAMDTVPKHLTLKLVEKAKATHDCAVSVAEGHGDELIRELKAHRLDILVANYAPPVTEGQGLYARRIARMPVVICAARKFAHLKRNFPLSLDGQPFVMPSIGSRLRHDLDHYFKLARIKPVVSVEVQDTSLQKLLGTHGAGLIPIAAPAIEELIETKELIVLGELPDVHEELWLIAGERRIQNCVAAQLMQDFSL